MCFSSEEGGIRGFESFSFFMKLSVGAPPCYERYRGVSTAPSPVSAAAPPEPTASLSAKRLAFDGWETCLILRLCHTSALRSRHVSIDPRPRAGAGSRRLRRVGTERRPPRPPRPGRHRSAGLPHRPVQPAMHLLHARGRSALAAEADPAR